MSSKNLENTLLMYKDEIKKLEKKKNIITFIENISMCAGVMSFVSLVIHPLALVPLAISIGANIYTGKKEKTYENKIYELITQKTTLESELKKEYKLNRNNSNSIEPVYNNQKMTAGISHKPLIKTKIPK